VEDPLVALETLGPYVVTTTDYGWVSISA